MKKRKRIKKKKTNPNVNFRCNSTIINYFIYIFCHNSDMAEYE